ncbi:hypothetical protein P4H71_05005 [Paenibacillus kribbensis]|uniref:hypothetical protein n=1 Tax=Paenibacillus kribbensis TaxID=172713 RepID=UPI002DBA36BE|nr:hypothetical protein [Paenibacillus kribbensis]MEC0233714.1 hypothetical protein [Paenibacillus kribbensis]
MIDMLDMTDQQLNMQLEILLGAKEDRHRKGNVIKGTYSTSPKDYCTDPAASLEVQAKAIEVGAVKYMAHLVYCTGHNYHDGLTMDTARDMLLATSRQRAEAAYITLSSQD